jgi:dolichyl-phosphate-mannose-protein mannosyltransferase
MWPFTPSTRGRSTLGTIVPIVLIGACLISNVIWDLADQKVWDWDPCGYAIATLQLWDATSLGLWNWLDAMAHAWPDKPPLMIWLGQFFIPLRHLTGEVESALLAVNIFGAGVTLALVYVTGRRLGATIFVAAIGVLACASSPAFVGLTGRYLVEITQCMAAAVMTYAACGIERRSAVRGISLATMGVVFSFLSKASSMTLVVPLLIYVLVACWLGRKHRPVTRPMDFVWLFVAAVSVAALLIWYFINWNAVIQHFIDATNSRTALYYGKPVILGEKVSLWLGGFALALSPLPGLLPAVALLIVAGLLVEIGRLRGTPVLEGLERLRRNETLFALALAGTVTLTILAFSLQINEDTRFITPLVPLTAALLAWSLSILRSNLLAYLALTVFSINAIACHAYAHGIDPAKLTVFSYLQKVGLNADDKELLTRMVRSTCQPSLGNRINIIVVNNPSFSGSNATFYSIKDSLALGYRCRYSDLPVSFDESDINAVVNKIISLDPPYVISVVPERQSKAEFYNRIAKPITQSLQRDSRFEVIAGLSDDYLLIFQIVR